MQKIIQGELIYNESGEYIINNFNLSSLFSRIYYATISNYLNIKIMQGCKTLFNEDGNLYKKKDDDGIYSYHLCGNNVELQLFNLVGQTIEIILSTTSIGADYGQSISTI